jgi:hypothetical protein
MKWSYAICPESKARASIKMKIRTWIKKALKVAIRPALGGQNIMGRPPVRPRTFQGKLCYPTASEATRALFLRWRDGLTDCLTMPHIARCQVAENPKGRSGCIYSGDAWTR